MKSIQPHLVFNGNCAEAMNFYKHCIGGELFVLPYDKAPIPEFSAIKDRVLHASLTTGTAELRGSDAHPNSPARMGDNFNVVLHCEGPEETARVFRALAEGGSITLPLHKSFFSDNFGMLVDRFGVQWKVLSSK